MSDAAERIWIGLGMPGYISDEPALDLYDVEYIRADIHDAKIKELEAQLEWQPIETAPKDGTRILIADATTRLVRECRYEYYDWSDPVYSEWYFEATATHWMPLPKPPKESK